MRSFLVKPSPCLKGKISLPGDKSIAHRAVIISAITSGRTTIKNFPSNQDCLYTLKVFKKLGIRISEDKGAVTVYGRGLYGLREPKGHIFAGNSGTTLRLISGILAGQSFEANLRAGRPLSKRPMLRLNYPLRLMGAEIKARQRAHGVEQEEYPPLSIKGGNLKAIVYRMPIASAQVKSAILLAGLYAKGKTCVIEKIKTRDHTERILKLFKAEIKVTKNKVVVKGGKELASPGSFTLPGDISSASFFIVLAAILPNSKLVIKNIGLNPSRAGILKVLRRMGADIRINNYRLPSADYEPAGDIIVKSSFLKGAVIRKEEVPSLIDELPILMVAAASAKGKSIFEGVQELRLKETDRISSMSDNLRQMGVKIDVIKTALSEKIVIFGQEMLKPARVKSFGDHRTAMSMIVAGLKASGIGRTRIDNIDCISKSFPVFLTILKKII